jgi:hypothetical protein
VIVGNLPTIDGTSDTIQAPGSLLILDASGKLVTTLTDSARLDGPWDLTINDEGQSAQVFVSNVLSGTVERLDLKMPGNGNPVVVSETQIASGYKHTTDPAALVLGPTGLAFDAQHDILYVASTDNNAIFAIPNAKETRVDHGRGSMIYRDNMHLHGPLALVMDPNGDLITCNGDAVNATADVNEMVEFTPSGHFIAEVPTDTTGIPGGAFGLAVTTTGNTIQFAAIDDNFNQVMVWTINEESDGASLGLGVGTSLGAGTAFSSHGSVSVSEGNQHLSSVYRQGSDSAGIPTHTARSTVNDSHLGLHHNAQIRTVDLAFALLDGDIFA